MGFAPVLAAVNTFTLTAMRNLPILMIDGWRSNAFATAVRAQVPGSDFMTPHLAFGRCTGADVLIHAYCPGLTSEVLHSYLKQSDAPVVNVESERDSVTFWNYRVGDDVLMEDLYSAHDALPSRLVSGANIKVPLQALHRGSVRRFSLVDVLRRIQYWRERPSRNVLGDPLALDVICNSANARSLAGFLRDVGYAVDVQYYVTDKRTAVQSWHGLLGDSVSSDCYFDNVLPGRLPQPALRGGDHLIVTTLVKLLADQEWDDYLVAHLATFIDVKGVLSLTYVSELSVLARAGAV